LHAEENFRIDRRSTLSVGIAGSCQFPDERQVEDAVNSAEEVVFSDKRLQVNADLGLRIECMHPLHGDSLLENSCVRNETPPETQSNKENQAESELAKLLFFNRPHHYSEQRRHLTWAVARRGRPACSKSSGSLARSGRADISLRKSSVMTRPLRQASLGEEDEM
jgi:hypothetical protein